MTNEQWLVYLYGKLNKLDKIIDKALAKANELLDEDKKESK